MVGCAHKHRPASTTSRWRRCRLETLSKDSSGDGSSSRPETRSTRSAFASASPTGLFTPHHSVKLAASSGVAASNRKALGVLPASPQSSLVPPLPPTGARSRVGDGTGCTGVSGEWAESGSVDGSSLLCSGVSGTALSAPRCWLPVRRLRSSKAMKKPPPSPCVGSTRTHFLSSSAAAAAAPSSGDTSG